ncbi:MAG: hypothetical protein ACETVN_05240, partial [Asgard group archaeon]
YECSAKDGRNIEMIFRSMALKMLKGAEEKKKAVTAATPTSAEAEKREVAISTPLISTSIVKKPPTIVSVIPFRYIEETTIPFILTENNDVLTQDIELATAFMLGEDLRSPDESLDAITKIQWPMYIIPYKGGSFLLDGFKIVSNEFIITQNPTVEEIESILNVSELKNAETNLDRVKNLLSNLSARKFTVHALHQPALLRDMMPFIKHTASLKTVPSYELDPDITLQVATMFPSEFDNFSTNIIAFRQAWAKISESLNKKFLKFRQEITSLGSQIRKTYQDQLQELKKEMDQQTISLQVRYEEQLEELEKSLQSKAGQQTTLENVQEQIVGYRKECDIRIKEQEELFETVQNAKEQTISFLEATKEKFNQLDTLIRTIKDKQTELINIIQEYSNKTTSEEKQPEKFVVKELHTQKTTQIGLPFYCIKYLRGFSPRYVVIPPLIFSPSEKYSGEKIGKNEIFTPTSLKFLFKDKIEIKLNKSEQFRQIVEVTFNEQNLLKMRDIKERFQEGLEDLLNQGIIDPQGWKWLKTRLEAVL